MYCVKCGVELDESAKKCPLCNTKVIVDVNDIADIKPQEEPKPPYSDLIMIPPKKQKKFIAFVITMILLIPSFVTLVVNLLFPTSGMWSAHVVGTGILVWIVFVYPFLRQTNPQVLAFFDAVAISAYTLMYYIILHEHNWYFKAALPCIAIAWLMVEVFLIWLFREKRDWPDVGIFVLVAIAIGSILVDAILEAYFATGWVLRYSVIVSVSCLLLIFFFGAAKRSKHFKAWISRNFYY